MLLLKKLGVRLVNAEYINDKVVNKCVNDINGALLQAHVLCLLISTTALSILKEPLNTKGVPSFYRFDLVMLLEFV
ncbi:hypothetical protein P3L10_011899 [Capsicum annuum]